MICVIKKNIKLAEVLMKYEHGARNENGLPAIHLVNQMEDGALKLQFLQLLFYKEKQILIKTRVGGKLSISTFE